MIIKVEKLKEADVLEYCCAGYGLTCRLFTMENNDKMLQAEVVHSDGGELDATTAWLLCRSVNVKLEGLEL